MACITGVAKTVTAVAGVGAPKQAGPSIGVILNSAKAAFSGKMPTECLCTIPTQSRFGRFGNICLCLKKRF